MKQAAAALRLGAGRTPLVGRRPELAALNAGLARTISGETTVFFLSGEAGVGKSRLVAEFACKARGAGARVVTGHCIAFGEPVFPFVPLAEVFRALAHDLGPNGVDQLVQGRLRELALLVPELAGPTRTAEGGTSGSSPRDRLFELVLTLLERLCEQAPLVLVLEDVQSADASTRDLLSFLLGNMASGRLMVVLTYRSDEVRRGRPLRSFLTDVDRLRRAHRIELARLNKAELIAQLSAMQGALPEPDLIEAIWERSEGNPLFTEELFVAAHRHERGLPPTLEDLLVCRLEALSADAQRMIRVASAGSRSFTQGLLAAVADMPGPELTEALREAVAQHILVVDRESGTYAFRHALQQEVAYADLLPGERTSIHNAYAAALTGEPELGGGPDEMAGQLARHWYAAHDTDRALAAAVEAGKLARRRFGFGEAQLYFERALALWEKVTDPSKCADIDRSDLLQQAAKVAALAGNHRRASSLLRVAVADADSGGNQMQAGLLLERLGRCLWSAGASEEALATYEEALRRIPQHPPTVERACALAAQGEALTLLSRYREASVCCQDTILIASAVGAKAQEGRSRRNLGVSLVFLGKSDRGLIELNEALRIAEALDDPEEVALAHLNLADVLAGPLNRAEEAAELALAGIQRVIQVGLQRDYGVSLQAIAADALFRLGRWDEADVFLGEALERNPTGAAAIGLYLARGKLSVGRGQFEAAANDLLTAKDLARSALDPRYHVPLCTLTAGLAMWQGRLDEARAAIADGLACLAGTDDRWYLPPLVWHGMRAEADRAERGRARGEPAEVDAALDAGQALHMQLRGGSKPGSGVRVSEEMLVAYSLLSDGEWSRIEGSSDPAAWAAAALTWERLGQIYPAAYARARQGEALIELGEIDQAAPLLAAAHSVAERLGAKPFQREIELLALRSRIPLNPESASAAAAPGSPSAALKLHLTAREIEVLRLLAEGRTNRQIGAQLYISEKTASVHVSNILTKLGVSRRGEAAAVAHRLGLLAPQGT